MFPGGRANPVVAGQISVGTKERRPGSPFRSSAGQFVGVCTERRLQGSRRGLSWAGCPRAAHHRSQVPRLALASQPAAAGPHPQRSANRLDVPSSRSRAARCSIEPVARGVLPRPGTYRPPAIPPPASRRRQAAAANRRHREPPPQRTAGIRHRSPLRSDGGRGPDCRFPRQRHAVANEFLNGYPVPSSYRHRTVFTDTSRNLECEISLPVWTMNQALSLKGMSLPPSYRSCRASARWLRAG